LILDLGSEGGEGLRSFNINTIFIIIFAIPIIILIYKTIKIIYPPYLLRIYEKGILFNLRFNDHIGKFNDRSNDIFISFNKLKEIKIMKRMGDKQIRFTSVNDRHYFLMKPWWTNMDDLIEQMMAVMKFKGGAVYFGRIEQ
jgi:hypothetical protein